MAGKSNFSVVISAVDKASGALASINKRMASVNATVAKAREPFDRLASNYNKFLQLTGADKIAGGLARVGRAGFSAFQSVLRIIEPLAAITGAASVAGMYRLATAWAEFGTQLGNAANRAGTSATELQQLQVAAQLAGVSADTLTSGIISFRDGINDAVNGKSPQLRQILTALGLDFDQVAKMAPIDQLKAVADKIAALPTPTLQAEAATKAFGSAGEQLLPFLRKGADGIEEYAKKAEFFGLTSQSGVEAANKLRGAQADLTAAVTGLGNSIAEKLAPVIMPLLDQLANWIALNREWIATGIGTAVQQFADYIKGVDWAKVGTDIDGIYHAVKSVADAFGGWVSAGTLVLEFFAAVWAAKMLAPIVKIGAALLKLPGQAATAATEANGELGKIGSGRGGLLKGLGIGAMLSMLPDILSGAAGDRAAQNLDDRDQKAFDDVQPQRDDRAWYERLYKPGPGIFGGGNAAPDSNQLRLQAEGHWANENQPPSAPNGVPRTGPAFGGQASPISYEAPSLPAGASGRGPQWANDLKQLQGYGWSKEQAAGILGNLDQESGGRENAVGDGGQAFGLAQWHADRQADFAKLYHHSIQQGTHAEQVGFVNWELNNTEQSAGNHLREASDARGSAAAIRKYYERPANVTGQEDQWRGDRAARILAANQPPAPSGPPVVVAAKGPAAPSAFVAFASKGPPSPSGAAVNLPANAGTAANPGGAGVMPDGSVQVGIKLAGLPNTATTTATQTGQGLAPLKIERSNVGFGQASA